MRLPDAPSALAAVPRAANQLKADTPGCATSEAGSGQHGSQADLSLSSQELHSLPGASQKGCLCKMEVLGQHFILTLQSALETGGAGGIQGQAAVC